ncbi:haloacid dehalogenase-like hydrolase domain-containing protein At2g33255 [Dendronephthya gigantea]|uniref:haloacid dehalogenase-like hydrolase domain-containing protein At2g33255 n=1 Tax=Dendronephthya gigantea TaxID=151771 RepID=UPI001068E6EC|nr:haloacid dehalogenase-like hydrolase domain-containing protein At2g33255 [Dendronephthya gigantea]
MSCTRFSYVLTSSLREIVPIFGVIFDLDGTLTVPVLDFSILRKRLKLKGFNLTANDDILGSLEKQKSLSEKTEMLRIIEEFEAEGRERFSLQPGVDEMLETFDKSGIKLAIMTRNDHRAVEQFLKHLKPRFQDGKVFSHILTRDFKPVKPDPAPVLHICKEWKIQCCNTVVVGDHLQDIKCGKAAGAVTVLINNDSNASFKEIADHNVNTLMELVNDLQTEQVMKSS